MAGEFSMRMKMRMRKRLEVLYRCRVSTLIPIRNMPYTYLV